MKESTPPSCRYRASLGKRNWTENVEIEQALGEFLPRSEVYLRGGVGEPLVLRELLRAHPATLEGVGLTSCLPPQMNEFDYAA